MLPFYFKNNIILNVFLTINLHTPIETFPKKKIMPTNIYSI